MELEQTRKRPDGSWEPHPPEKLKDAAQLVFVFGGRDQLAKQDWIDEIASAYPNAQLVGCTSAGEIMGTEITDDHVVVTAVKFKSTRIKTADTVVESLEKSRAAGEELTAALPKEGLVHTFVLSDGIHINGSELVRGLTRDLPDGVTVTGGLAGDGARFEQTLILLGREAKPKRVVVVGLYGPDLKVGYGSLGGWDPFGPERLITRSQGNILYELDGQPALDVYEKYLGEHAKDLPASGLLFPLNLRLPDGETGVVRTLLAIDRQAKSLTFAGDVPEGAYAQLMKANFDRLVEGADGAAKVSAGAMGKPAELAILISCVGRKLILKQRTEEEVEAVQRVVGDQAVYTGFYSYGEISPFTPNAKCELHNQTMTITTFAEA